jgi:APA family basic amino acid/polyamine antiporter
MSWNHIFARKNLDELVQEATGDQRLKRALGPIALTSLGIGAVIGAGIFVATGEAANKYAGPALMVSYMVAGVTCVFAALCYAEFASMAPVAGSAYTYAYVTLGELVAWIIGWDLVLEYAVGAATVANGWSGYLQKILPKLGITVPLLLSGSPWNYDQGYIIPNVTADYARAEVAQSLLQDVTVKPEDAGRPLKVTQRVMKTKSHDGTEKPVSWADGEERPANGIFWTFTVKKANPDKTEASQTIVVGPVGNSDVEAKITKHQQSLLNLPAILITFLVTAVLVKGISESANFNALMVFIKVAAVVFVVLVGSRYVNPDNWTPFAPYGWAGISFFGHPMPDINLFGVSLQSQTNEAGDPVGMLAGASIIFFAYIGFDSVSTHAEEAKNPQRDVPVGIVTSLVICTVLYIAVVAVLTGMVKYDKIDANAGVSSAFEQIGLGWAEVIIASAGVAGITSVLLVMMLSAPRVFLAMARDGLVPKSFFADVHPRFRTPWKSTIAIGIFVAFMAGFLPLGILLHLTNIGTLFAFVVVCAAVLVMRYTSPDAVRPFRCPLVPVIPVLGILSCLLLMFSLPAANWYRLIVWMGLGLVIYFGYGYWHSTLRAPRELKVADH